MALALVLGSWIVLRAATWTQWPELVPLEADRSGQPLQVAGRTPEAPQAAAATRVLPAPVAYWPGRPLEPRLGPIPGPGPRAARVELPPPAVLAAPDRPLRHIATPVSPRLAGGHALLWLAAVSQLPGPLALLEQTGRRPAGTPPAAPWPRTATVATPRRWSGDAWALVRAGGGGAGAASFGPTYGASQVGAVLRYRLAPTSGHRPTAYVRATAALEGPDREVAAGLSLRPIPKLPVALAAEGRVSRLGTATEVRPALVAVTELAPVTLPAGVRAEFYAQGGYVGGQAGTAFVDGSLRLDRRVAQVGKFELRAGAGAWGGAQEGAQRLDIGPTATIGVTHGRGAARLALDWRLRVAGEAAPASGPALTISAGF